MVAGDAKRVVVIRNISSNLIEEAILILRNEPNAADDGNVSKTGNRKRKIDNDFLVKEAENIIKNYVRENHMQLTHDSRNIRGKKGILGIFRSKPLINALVNILLLGSIVLLIYIVCKLV